MNNKGIIFNCKKVVKALAVKTAKSEANVTCPFISYQPEISDAVLKLKKKLMIIENN